MMDKSILEKRIHDKAEKRADKYFEEVRSFFESHNELVYYNHEGLFMNPSDNGTPKRYFKSGYSNFNGIFDSQKELSKFTNWQDIRKELVEKYEKEETDNILDKLDSINYLLEDD
ncbi:hypothetical protein KBX44_06480 [Lentilactobacillus kefiri]|nr:hypothetical protein [Lentilactobacillus kefiri]